MSLTSVLGTFTAAASAVGLSEEGYYIKAVAEGNLAILAAIKAVAVAQGDATVAAAIDTAVAGVGVLKSGDTMTGDLIVQGTVIGRKDNASSMRVKGPQAPSEGGADVQSYSGIFYNDAYAGTGTKKTRAIHGANVEMDLEIQSPHQLRLVAVDDTQTDGKVYVASKTCVAINARADAEVASPKQLLVDRMTTGTTGAANTSDVNMKASSGNLHLQGGMLAGVVFPAMTQAQRDAQTLVAGLVVFNTDSGKLEAYSGAAWLVL